MSKSKEQYVDISFSSRERVAILQALEDEVKKLQTIPWLDEDKRYNRIIVCKKAMAKVLNTLHRKDFEEVEAE